jgi:hypothetical protein
VAEKIQASVSSAESSSGASAQESSEKRNGSNGNSNKPEKVETFNIEDRMGTTVLPRLEQLQPVPIRVPGTRDR